MSQTGPPVASPSPLPQAALWRQGEGQGSGQRCLVREIQCGPSLPLLDSHYRERDSVGGAAERPRPLRLQLRTGGEGRCGQGWLSMLPAKTTSPTGIPGGLHNAGATGWLRQSHLGSFFKTTDSQAPSRCTEPGSPGVGSNVYILKVPRGDCDAQAGFDPAGSQL